MEKLKPIKRSKELVTLSRDHHEGLLLCWKIRTGFAKGIETERIARYVAYFYETNLKHHFDIEEKYLFVLMPHDHPLIIKALAEHQYISHEISLLHKADVVDVNAIINNIGKLIEMHIRFEERELFPLLEQVVAPELLVEAGKNIDGHFNKNELIWEDAFWA